MAIRAAWSSATTITGRRRSASRSSGRYQYTVRGWTDPFLTWRRDLVKRRDAGQDLTIDLQIGAEILGSEIPSYEAAMDAEPPRPRDEWVVTSEKTLEVVVDPVRARFSSWYEMFPRSFGGFRGMIEVLPLRRAPRLRCPLPAAGAPDRHHGAQGQEQRRERAAGRHRQSLGDRLEGGRPQGAASGAGDLRRFSRPGRSRRKARHPDRAGHRLPVLARPSLREGAPGVVPRAPRRHHPVRREPAEEVPGHLPVRFRKRELDRALERAEKHLRVLGRPRREDLPRRQPAHQGVRVLGVGDFGPEAASIPSSSFSPRRSPARA